MDFKLTNWFLNYFHSFISNHNLTQEKIIDCSRKLAHSFLVADLFDEIGRIESLDRKLCFQIGLLHDIGRFSQIERFGTFNDKESIDHGRLGAKIIAVNLPSASLVNKELIKQAIIDHNQNSEPRDLYSRFLRDADKIAIMLKFASDETWKNMDANSISPHAQDEFRRNDFIYPSDLRNDSDLLLLYYLWSNNLNYKSSKHLLNSSPSFVRLYHKFKESFPIT